MVDKKYYTFIEMAKEIGASYRHVRNLLNRHGSIEIDYVGNRRRFSQESVDALSALFGKWSFAEARKYMIANSLFFGTDEKHAAWARTPECPSKMPSCPRKSYRSQWQGYYHFCGRKAFMDFKDAREFVLALKLETCEDWVEWSSSGDRPINIPSCPRNVYKNKGWDGWRDWLGPYEKWLSYEDAKEVVQGLGLHHHHAYRRWFIDNDVKTWDYAGKRLPHQPKHTYKDCWVSWSDFLFNEKFGFLSYGEAREYVHTLGIESHSEWLEYAQGGTKPKDIPSNPYETYADKGWVNWMDWLGYKQQRRKGQK